MANIESNAQKKYIDDDEKIMNKAFAMLQVDAKDGWWDEMPDNVREDVEEAMLQADRGEGITHDEVKKKYSKWFVS